MNASTTQIPLPDKIIPFINALPDGDTLDDKATLAVVLGLFAAKIVNLGKAAELAGKKHLGFYRLPQKPPDSLGRIHRGKCGNG